MTALTQNQELKRLRTAVADMAEYSPYRGTREYAEHARDYSTPLVVSTPLRNTGTVNPQSQRN